MVNMIRADFKYHCQDCLETSDIIQCFDGHLTYDLCLDCFLERERQAHEYYKEYQKEQMEKNMRLGEYE
jgi:hypothetical protein